MTHSFAKNNETLDLLIHFRTYFDHKTLKVHGNINDREAFKT